jgi:hypothetical protein
MLTLNEEDLIRGLKAGDASTFKELFDDILLWSLTLHFECFKIKKMPKMLRRCVHPSA